MNILRLLLMSDSKKLVGGGANCGKLLILFLRRLKNSLLKTKGDFASFCE